MSETKRKPKTRGNGQGSAYRRGTGWEACVVIGWRAPSDPSKHPVPIKRRRAGFNTKKEALAYCQALLDPDYKAKRTAPRLISYWNSYKENEYLQLSKSKQIAYAIAWKKLTSIQDIRVDAITVDMLRAAVADQCSSYYTARDCRSLLSNLFQLAAADRFATKDLPSFIVLPPLQETERETFSTDEQTALWKLYESGDLRACIPLLMIYTGMMPGEAQALQVQHINLEDRTITHAGLKTKVRKATPIVISQALLPVMQDLIDHAMPSGYIFKRVVDDWYKDYYDALAAAGCRRLTPYCCRHTTATALAITENIAPQTIKKIMRWSTTKMLDHYAHPQISDALAGVDALEHVGSSAGSKPE
jgi:integrase